MKNFSWKKRLFLSYIFVGAIPLFLLGAFFSLANRMTVRQETEKNNASMLAQVVQKMDYVTEKMNSSAYHFSGTEMAGQLDAVRNQAVDIDEGMVCSQLATYAGMIADEESPVKMLLYLRGDRYIYTLEGRVPYLTFEEDMQRYGDLNQASFFTLINSLNRDRSLKISPDEKKQNQNAMTWFLYPVPYMNNIPVATVGFGVDRQAMENMVKAYYPLNSAIYIFNGQKQNIYEKYPEEMPEKEKTAIGRLAAEYRKTGIRIGTEKVDGKEFVVMREISANSGYTVVTVTQKDSFYQYDTIFTSWFAALLLILFIGGILLSVVLSRSSYRPIQNLLDKVVREEGQGEGAAGESNEFELLNSRWTDIQNKNEELIALVNRQRPMVVASCLRRILKGKFHSREEMEATLKSAAINLGYRYHFVILIPIPVEEGFDSEKSIQILSVLENGMQPWLHLYGLDMLKDDGIAILVNCQERESASDQCEIRTAVASRLQTELQTEYGIEIPFYIGRIYEDPMEISRSFIEAAAIAGDYRFPGNQKIILFEQIGMEEQNLQYPVLEQAVYIQCLKQANEEEALTALHNMIREIEPLKSFVITQCLCFDIINAAVKTLDQMKGFELKDVDLKKICCFASLSEFREKAGFLTSQICRQLAEFRDSSHDRLKSEILTWVNQHFGESSMGLEAVADQFHISANYLSRFFKQETGCTFIQYVTMIRMDRAKELLINSEMQVKDIVAQIGYIDVANFVRKFKNYEGVTPGQYRERMRKR